MNLIDELIDRGVARSRRQLSTIIGRAPNFLACTRGFRAEDLVHLRLHLIERGGPADLKEKIELMLLEPWER